MSGEPWYRFSMHALSRALDMACTAEELKAVLETPDKIDGKSQRYPDASVYVKGKIAMPVSSDGTVITVLWRRRKGMGQRWDRDDISLSRDDPLPGVDEYVDGMNEARRREK